VIDMRLCFGVLSNFGFSKMTTADTIIDIDLFRRIRQTLSEETHRPSRSLDEAKAT
jgi:hypothetical protein